jgi:hypothetical protein
MKRNSRLIGIAGLFASGALFLEPGSVRAIEPFAIYESWSTAPTIRSDRWFGASDLGQERLRRVAGDKLVMRFRKESGTASDSGATGFFSNRLFFANPAAVDQVEAEFKVRDLVVTGCPINATASIARAAAIDLAKFSDLAPAAVRPPGDLTGDYIARVQAARTSASTDPDGKLDVTAVLFRCNNPACSATTTVAGPFALGEVALKKKFRMRLAWDAGANQFSASLGNAPEVLLPYSPATNSRPGDVPFVALRTQHLPANCTRASGGPTVGDAEIEVGEVRTNVSAVIP